MHQLDAGPREDVSRGDRVREVIRSILSRLDTRRTRVSMIAFYTEAKPVIVDTFAGRDNEGAASDRRIQHLRAQRRRHHSLGTDGSQRAAGEIAAEKLPQLQNGLCQKKRKQSASRCKSPGKKPGEQEEKKDARESVKKNNSAGLP